MINIDWSLVQLQYEIFGATIEDLAAEYGMTSHILSYAVESRGWKRSETAALTRTLPPAERSAPGVQTQVVDKAALTESITENQTLLRAIKQSTLSPRYIALEASLLSKCLNLVSNLSDDDPTNATALKLVSDILKSLTDSHHIKAPANDSGSGAINVSIMSQVKTPDGSATPVEVNEAITVSVDGVQQSGSGLPDAMRDAERSAAVAG